MHLGRSHVWIAGGRQHGHTRQLPGNRQTDSFNWPQLGRSGWRRLRCHPSGPLLGVAVGQEIFLFMIDPQAEVQQSSVTVFHI